MSTDLSAWNTHAHTHTHTHTHTHLKAHADMHTQCHFVRGKDKHTVSPHPHRATHKHANRYTHTGGCCVAPTSTCGVFSFCLFWERKMNRFSSSRPLGISSPTVTSRFPEGGQNPVRVHRLSMWLLRFLGTPNLHISND
jgi:hypothetical protein